MSSAPRRSLPLGAWPFVAVVAAVSALLHVSLSRWPYDDAFIHFRIVRQWLTQGAPYFNPGEAVLATSSPGWTWVLAPLFLLPGPETQWVALVNALVVTAAVVLFCRLLMRLGGEPLGWPWVVGYAVPALALLHPAGVGLMETPLALLVLAVAVSLYLARKDTAFFWLGLAPFLRPELGVFSGLLFVHALLRRPGGVARRVGLALAGALPFVVWELAYFGTVVPNPIRAKSVVYELPPGQVLTVLAEALSPIAPLAPRPSALIFGVTAVLLLGLVAAVHEQVRKTLPRETRELVGLLAAGGLIVGFGYLIAGGLVFPWYLPLVAIPFSFALWVLLARSRAGQVAIVVVLILPHAVGLGRSLAAAVADPALYRYFAQNARVGKYLEVGRRLDARYPDATLLSSEVGALGWAFRGRVLDGAGLISPEAIRHHPMRVPEERSLGFIGAIPVAYVAERRPGLIVSLDIFIEAFSRSPEIQDYVHLREPVYTEADLARARSSVLWWSRHMNVFIRRDLAAEPPAAGAP